MYTQQDQNHHQQTGKRLSKSTAFFKGVRRSSLKAAYKVNRIDLNWNPFLMDRKNTSSWNIDVVQKSDMTPLQHTYRQ